MSPALTPHHGMKRCFRPAPLVSGFVVTISFLAASSAQVRSVDTGAGTTLLIPFEDLLEREHGPAAALMFALRYRGENAEPKALHCYPDAVGVPLAECKNIVPMAAGLWTPAQLAADFQRRMSGVPESERKQGIIVLLKTERCATTALRACTVTTAALEKRSTPLAAQFLVYGVLLKPRDDDVPAGSLLIETGADAWKNEAAGEYHFQQGPGATLVFLDPRDGSKLERTDAVALRLFERPFLREEGRTPALHAKLEEILARLLRRSSPSPDAD